MTSSVILHDPATMPRDAPPRDAPARDDSASRAVAITALAGPSDVTGAVDWQRLWLAAQRATWTSLALVPVGATVATPRLAAALAEVGREHLGGTVVACDLTTVSLSSLKSELHALAERARCAERAVLALPPLHGSPAGLALARAADAVILCVTLGDSSITEAEQTLADIGPDRVLGSVIVRPRKETS